MGKDTLAATRRSLHGVAELVPAGPQYRHSGSIELRAAAGGPVLWPEHFDIAVTLDEVNYDVSPGDEHIAEPYAYLGPWQPRTGPFWNASFGAARPLTELPDADAVLDFFREGRRQAHEA